MLAELIDLLELRKGSRVLDCTLGGGGHAEAVLKLIGGTGQLTGIDCDGEALEAAQQRLGSFASFRAVRANFAEIGELDLGSFDAAYMDLGVSSAQLDRAWRGFSFRFEAPLDMRMDSRLETTAADLLQDLDERELAQMFRKYGEEPHAGRIARKIVASRPVTTTTQLAALVEDVVPKRGPTRIHPATRVFQALRIAVNRELEVLEEGVEAAWNVLVPGGRLAVMSYHSLEDRLVKNFFRSREGRCTCPRDLPICICNPVQELKSVGKSVTASAAETERNPRARSARLRVAEKVESHE